MENAADVACLDGGSTPPGSTQKNVKKKPVSLVFMGFFCGVNWSRIKYGANKEVASTLFGNH